MANAAPDEIYGLPPAQVVSRKLIHNNPVRAGIVEEAMDYPFSSIAACSDLPTIIKVARL